MIQPQTLRFTHWNWWRFTWSEMLLHQLSNSYWCFEKSQPQ